MHATFVQRGEAVDFIPARDVAAGEIIRFGALLGVVKVPVKNGELGTLSLSGIYDVVKIADAVTAGSKVYWDDVAKLATTDDTGNAFWGVAACHSPATAVKVRIILNFGHPDVTVGESADGVQWQTIN